MTQSFAGLTQEVCVSVNEHKFWHWHEGKVLFTFGGTNDLDMWIDHIRIYRNGVLQDANTYPQWWEFVPYSETTDWAAQCRNSPPDVWYAQARYRFRAPNGSISAYFTTTSFNVNDVC